MRLCIPDAAFRHLINGAPDGNDPASVSSTSSSSSGRRADTGSGVSGGREALLSELSELFHKIPGTSQREAKVAMRMTRSPSRGCINFHYDGSYATGTVQIALNDQSEYHGDRLCFFVNEVLSVLDRPAGSVCQQPASVLRCHHPNGGNAQESLRGGPKQRIGGGRCSARGGSAGGPSFLASIPRGQDALCPPPRSHAETKGRSLREYACSEQTYIHIDVTIWMWQALGG
eukprot:1181654-Prorocentrum_minimum.AAC.3